MTMTATIVPHKLSFTIRNDIHDIYDICLAMVEILNAKGYEIDGNGDIITFRFEYTVLKFRYVKTLITNELSEYNVIYIGQIG